ERARVLRLAARRVKQVVRSSGWAQRWDPASEADCLEDLQRCILHAGILVAARQVADFTNGLPHGFEPGKERIAAARRLAEDHSFQGATKQRDRHQVSHQELASE